MFFRNLQLNFYIKESSLDQHILKDLIVNKLILDPLQLILEDLLKQILVKDLKSYWKV